MKKIEKITNKVEWIVFGAAVVITLKLRIYGVLIGMIGSLIILNIISSADDKKVNSIIFSSDLLFWAYMSVACASVVGILLSIPVVVWGAFQGFWPKVVSLLTLSYIAMVIALTFECVKEWLKLLLAKIEDAVAYSGIILFLVAMSAGIVNFEIVLTRFIPFGWVLVLLLLFIPSLLNNLFEKYYDNELANIIITLVGLVYFAVMIYGMISSTLIILFS